MKPTKGRYKFDHANALVQGPGGTLRRLANTNTS
jgi:hypothetical protein